MPPPSFPEAPDSLKNLKPYLKLANMHDDRDIVIAYWCRLEAIQQGLKNSSRSAEETQYLMKLMQWLEETKKEHHDNEAITNEVVAQAHLENWALKLFLYADENDRNGVFNKNVIQAFYTSSMIYQLIKTFGPLNEEAERNMKYAKWKSVYINNCLKKGETPVSGPLEKEEDDDMNVVNVEEEFDEISENEDGEYLDAVIQNFSADNEITDQENNPENNASEEKPEADENSKEIIDNEPDPEEIEEPKESEEENKNEEADKLSEDPINENSENGNEKEEVNEVPEDETKKDEEETEEPVVESEEENNEEAGSTDPRESDMAFPSVPSPSSTKVSNNDATTPVTPNQYNPAPTPTDPGGSFDKNDLAVKTEGGVELTPEQMVRAQKLIKWAGSALNYDDVSTAVTNLQQALNLLTTGQEKA